MTLTTQNRAVTKQPRHWPDVKGQTRVVANLTAALRDRKIAPAYLAVGPSGCGKTSVAGILFGAAQVCMEPSGVEPCWKCDACRSLLVRTWPDFKFVDGTADRSLGFVKESLIPYMQSKPWASPRRVLVVDEFHQYKVDAWSAFLTILETLPQVAPTTTVILCTTERDKIPITIRNRCVNLNFQALPASSLAEMVLDEFPSLDPPTLAALLDESGGSARTLYSILDSLEGEELTEASVRNQMGTLTSGDRMKLWELLASGDYRKVTDHWKKIIDRKIDLKTVGDQLIGDMTGLMAQNTGWAGWDGALNALGFAHITGHKHLWLGALFKLLNCPKMSEDVVRTELYVDMEEVAAKQTAKPDLDLSNLNAVSKFLYEVN